MCTLFLFCFTALAEAGQCLQPRVLHLLLHAVRLLHQGPPQPGAARPLSSPPAERRAKETSAAPARPGRGRGRSEPPRAVPSQRVPLKPRFVLSLTYFFCLLKLLWLYFFFFFLLFFLRLFSGLCSCVMSCFCHLYFFSCCTHTHTRPKSSFNFIFTCVFCFSNF